MICSFPITFLVLYIESFSAMELQTVGSFRNLTRVT